VHIFFEDHFDLWLKDIRKAPEKIYSFGVIPIPIDRDELIKKRMALHARYVNQVKDRLQNIDPRNAYIYQEGINTEFPEVGTQKYNEVLEKLISELPGRFPYMLLTQVGIPFLRNGAVLIGTENEGLLKECAAEVEEIEFDPSSMFNNEIPYPASVARRDQFIAKRIMDTLPARKTSILFIGGGHRPEKFFSRLITVYSHRDLYKKYKG